MSGDLHGEAGVSLRAVLEEEDEHTIAAEGEPAATPEDRPAARWHSLTAAPSTDPLKVEDDQPQIPRGVQRHLMSDETDIIALQRHRGLLIGPGLAAVGGLILAIIANALLYVNYAASLAAVRVIWFAYLAALAWAAWRWLEWRQTWFVITGHRVLLIRTTKLIGRDVTMLPVTKMRDVRLIIPPLGRICGYGTLDFASIGTERALDAVRFLPYPDWLYRECAALIMPDTERKPVKIRHAPGSSR